MLVLSRKLNEKIVIDGGIVVTVVKIDRNQIRLGIEAPGNVAYSAKRSPAPRAAACGRSRRALASDCRSDAWHLRPMRALDLRKVKEKIDMAAFCSTTGRGRLGYD